MSLESSPQQAPSPPSRGLRPVGIAVGALALIVVLTGSFTRWHAHADARQWSADQAEPTVRLIAPHPSAASNELVQPGTIQAWTSARIFARVPGYVHGWYADIGQRVGAGTALGRIDTPELDQQIDEARAALERARAESTLARTTASRWQDLLATTSVSRQAADEKTADAATRTAGVHEAQARLGRLLAMKDYATVRAPFGGILTLRNADIGDLVGPGATNPQPMFALADDHQLRVYVDVPQQYARQMRAGLMASLSVPAWPGRAFPAKVIDQSGAIDSQTGSLRVQLLAANPGNALKPGGFTQVHFDLPVPAGRTTIPSSALVLRGGGTRVATVDAGGHVHLIPVVVGHDLGSAVEITSGLGEGMKVIDSPPDSLADGDKVLVAAAKHG